MANKPAEFIGNLILRGKFECLTGLHIGGSKEKIEIGGVDSTVIRDPRTRFPYVPGSSLKGKLRSLLEYGLGVVPIGTNAKGIDVTGNVSTDKDIVRLFGIGADVKDPSKKDDFIKELEHIGPSRLVVRDCHPDEKTTKWWSKLDSDLPFTEIKSENGINRITSAANPRFIERVVAGSRFDFEMVYSVFNIKGDDSYKKDVADDLDHLRMALLLLEHNFIGKSGSRGYGRVKFYLADPIWISNENYKNGDGDLAKASAYLPSEIENLKSIADTKFEIKALKSPNFSQKT